MKTGTYLLVLTCLTLAACGGDSAAQKADVGGGDVLPDTGTPDTDNPDTGTPDTGNPDTGDPDTGNPHTGSEVAMTNTQHVLACSDEWQHCHQVGETWPQSYPELDAASAFQLALRWTMCGSMSVDSLPFFFSCALGKILSYNMPGVDAPSMECILAAKSCNEVRCCWGIDSGSACSNEDGEDAHCDGNVLVQAWPVNVGVDKVVDLVRKWDCSWSNGNPQCLMTTPEEQGDDTFPQCGAGTCTVGTPANCDGDTLVLCNDGVERRVDCVERGRICAPHVTEEGVEAACVLATQCLLPYCDGDTAVLCEGGNEVARVDCTAYGPGFSCQEGKVEDEKWTGGCRNPDATCDEDSDEDHCDGDMVYFCTDAGQWEGFDCSAFADGTCAMVPESINFGPSPPGGETVVYKPTCVEGLQ